MQHMPKRNSNAVKGRHRPREKVAAAMVTEEREDSEDAGEYQPRGRLDDNVRSIAWSKVLIFREVKSRVSG